MDPEIDLTGRRIGRYEIRSLLGRGGMGAVYRAYDSNLDRSVAIKILPPHLVTDADRVRRFMQEAKSASALNHPHVISIYEIGEHQDDGATMHYIAMELVEGATLRDRMGGAALDLRRALIIGEQIAEAIGAAHEAGVVHRDLKPENIIIAASGYVKVLDFGLAKLRRETSGDAATEVKSTEPGRVLGTVGYMSPEQAEGKPVDHRSDIFSLGCILYEMVSGRSPFRGRSQVETMHNIAHVDPPRLSGPPELLRIIGKALEKAPEERYQSAKDLAVDLKRLLRELDSATSLSSGAVGSQPTGRSFAGLRARRSMIAIVAALLAIIAAFVFLRRARESARAPAAQPPLTIKRITSTGNVIAAAISPDAKYIAYVNSEHGQHSLWLRHLVTRQDLQLIAPAEVAFWGHSFSPDGASIYYALKSAKKPLGTLYSIAILGGRSQKILDGIDSPVAFSPDGKKIAFVRAESAPGESSLVEANADGSGVRVLAKRRDPQYFVPIFYTGPSWSPDGKRIAVSEAMRSQGGSRAAIIEVDVGSGAERVILSGWLATQQVAWTPDGNDLIVIGSRERNQTETQVWRVPLPSGEPRPITNDLFDYRMATVTADGSTIVTVAADVDADLWLVPFDTAVTPRKLRGGKAVGVGGVSVARDGSIAYASLDGGNLDIWISDAEGVTARQLTNDPYAEHHPQFTPDGKSVIFSGYGQGTSIRRIAVDGSDTRPVKLYDSTSDQPALSPDGQTLVFQTPTGLAKAPVGGGTATAFADYFAQSPAISPDGTRIACYCRVHTGDPFRLCIIPMSGGAPEKTFEVVGPTFVSMIEWTPDGRALLLNTMPKDRRNIWRFPLDGGAPKALTNFNDQLLFRFDVTPDHQAFVVSRGDLSRDAVMITGFR